ncbi:response regulator transcription factor [Oceanobacillus sp. CAU 1775]
MKREKILIVEDDYDIQHLLQLYFEKEFKLHFSSDGVEAYETFTAVSPDLIILDIMLPGLDGIEVCKKIRKENKDVPIIFLSSKSEYDDRILGLEIGADDYIIKPFDPGEVLARVKAHLRRKNIAKRIQKKSKNSKVIGDLEINLDDYSIFLDGRKVKLFTKEKQLLLFLIQEPNRVFSIEQLYNHIWGEDKFGDFNTVKVHISNLRRKIEKDPANPVYIQTVRGYGYKFNS